MTVTPATLARVELTATPTTTLYTATAATVVTNVVLVNKTANATTVTLDIDGKYVAYALPIAPSQTIIIDLRQHIAAGTKTIRGGAAAGSAVDCHISGVTL